MVFRVFVLSYLILYLPFDQTLAQPAGSSDSIIRPGIASVYLHRQGWPLSMPLVSQFEEQQLLLGFDELLSSRTSFSWEIIHCNADWVADDLDEEEFLEGIPVHEISDALPSFNTTCLYWSYQLSLPGDGVRWLFSGNYLVRVFLTETPDSTVFTHRFMVSEAQASLSARQTPVAGDNSDGLQELEVEVRTGESSYLNQADYRLDIVPCGRWKAIHSRVPLQNRGAGVLVASRSPLCRFAGGNEFLNLDIKDLRYTSPEIYSIAYKPPYYRVVAKPDVFDPYRLYRFDEDLDGKFLLKANGAKNDRSDGEYAQVLFTLPVSFPFEENLYLSGNFSQRSYDPSCLMKYNYALGRYEKTFLLKEGYYTYEYVLAGKSKLCDYIAVNGSHSETQNEYLLLLYFTDIQKGYDRLIGHTLFNTLHPGN